MSSHRTGTHCLLLLIASIFPLGACTSSQLGASASLDNYAASRGISLTVENRNLADARVYLVRPGLRLRLGTVEAHQRRTFTVARSFLGFEGNFELESQLLASREQHRTDPIVVIAGDRVELLIGHRLTLSTVMVLR